MTLLSKYLFGLSCLASLVFVSSIQAQEDDKPSIKVATVIGVMPGSTTKFLLRGHKLDNAKEIKCSDGKSSAKILGQGNADNLNMQDAKKVGDRKVEIELTVPSDAPIGDLGLIIVTSKGESEPYQLFVGGEFSVMEDKEGNDGFRQAQVIAVPQIIDGSIHADRNVDVFVIDGHANQKLHCEIVAARRGSNLDAILSLYDERGVLQVTNDDTADSTDAQFDVVLPHAGKYFLVLQDAHDLGGQAHPYRLAIRKN